MRNTLFIVSLYLILSACGEKRNEVKFISEGNPIVTDKFTADPAPMVHNGRLYLYVGHDEAEEGQDFNITEWLCYSTKDMDRSWLCAETYGFLVGSWRSMGFPGCRERWEILLLYNGAG